jgi:hypothetical protein
MQRKVIKDSNKHFFFLYNYFFNKLSLPKLSLNKYL